LARCDRGAREEGTWVSSNVFKLYVVLLTHIHSHTTIASLSFALSSYTHSYVTPMPLHSIRRLAYVKVASTQHRQSTESVSIAKTFRENVSWRFWSCYENCDAIVALNCTVEDIDILRFRFVSIFRSFRPVKRAKQASKQ